MTWQRMTVATFLNAYGDFVERRSIPEGHAVIRRVVVTDIGVEAGLLREGSVPPTIARTRTIGYRRFELPAGQLNILVYVEDPDLGES